jgi:enoyl-CoA hydratase/carnithine racemase
MSFKNYFPIHPFHERCPSRSSRRRTAGGGGAVHRRGCDVRIAAPEANSSPTTSSSARAGGHGVLLAVPPLVGAGIAARLPDTGTIRRRRGLSIGFVQPCRKGRLLEEARRCADHGGEIANRLGLPRRP